MKVKLLTTISFFTYQLSISQTEKLLNGKVLSQKIPLHKVEVINKTAKTSTTTNENGEFSILVSVKDSVLFFSKDYFFKRLKISQENIDQNNIIVNMVLKPEELNEVVITNIKFPKVGPADENSTIIPKPGLQSYTGVYNGTIANGMNFMAIGGSIFSLFKSKDAKAKSKNRQHELTFKKLIESTVPLDYFTNDLKLKPDEKELFIHFCDADPQSELILKQKNLLYTLDFLFTKNQEFKKLNSRIKNYSHFYMKVKLPTTISFLTYQLSISQTEKLLHGKVISNKTPLDKVEVINKTAKTSTRTNERGEFSNYDPKSKTLLEKSNDLELLDFLYAKKEEFKKLK